MHRSLGARYQLIMSESGSAEDSQEKPDLKALGALPLILTHERESIYEVLSTGTHAPQITTRPPSGFITLGRLGSNVSQHKALIGADIKTLGTCSGRSIDVSPPTDVCSGHYICLWAWSQNHHPAAAASSPSRPHSVERRRRVFSCWRFYFGPDSSLEKTRLMVPLSWKWLLTHQGLHCLLSKPSCVQSTLNANRMGKVFSLTLLTHLSHLQQKACPKGSLSNQVPF